MSMPIYVNKVLYDDWATVPAVDGLMFFTGGDEIPKDEMFFLFGSIQDCKRLLFLRDCDPRYEKVLFAYHSMAVSDYYWELRELQLNWSSGQFKHLGHVTDGDLGKFCRSNSSDKLWAGQLLTDSTIDILREREADNLLLFLADAQPIQQEFRCWVDESEIIACSVYSPWRDMAEKKYKTKVSAYHLSALQELVQECLKRYYMGLAVVDIGIDAKGDYKIIELNCFSTSGFNDPEAFLKVIRHTKEEIMKL